MKKRKRKRVFRPHAPGIFNEDAPYWRGERCEKIVKRRLVGERQSSRTRLRLAFTGTRQGCTGRQRRALKRAINKIVDTYGAEHLVFVHGACEGADYQAHWDAIRAGVTHIEMWPSTAPTTRVHDLRAFTKTRAPQVTLKSHRPKPPLERNADIILRAFKLLACPKESREARRGGTWHTVRLARASHVAVKIIKP